MGPSNGRLVKSNQVLVRVQIRPVGTPRSPEEFDERCRHVVKIPTRFSINVGMAGAIVLYDRLLTLGRFAERPLAPGGPEEPIPPRAAWGAPIMRKRAKA